MIQLRKELLKGNDVIGKQLAKDNKYVGIDYFEFSETDEMYLAVKEKYLGLCSEMCEELAKIEVEKMASEPNSKVVYRDANDFYVMSFEYNNYTNRLTLRVMLTFEKI